VTGQLALLRFHMKAEVREHSGKSRLILSRVAGGDKLRASCGRRRKRRRQRQIRRVASNRRVASERTVPVNRRRFAKAPKRLP
ncbi:MAG: hypothetical protein KDA47_19445, partial [Planctomycetales bacterium]|nr:hypothetical protein [Planctomycetales bacterium]